MEKVILNNEQTFDVPALGIVANDLTKRRRITIKTNMNYSDVLALLSDHGNISQITYALENGAIIATYTDCVALKSLSCNFDESTYTAEFSTDATERIVQELQAKVTQLEQTINELTAKEEPVTEPTEEPSNPEP